MSCLKLACNHICHLPLLLLDSRIKKLINMYLRMNILIMMSSVSKNFNYLSQKIKSNATERMEIKPWLHLEVLILTIIISGLWKLLLFVFLIIFVRFCSVVSFLRYIRVFFRNFFQRTSRFQTDPALRRKH